MRNETVSRESGMGRRAFVNSGTCLVFGLAMAVAPALAANDPPIAVAARLVDDGRVARLSFDLSGPVEAVARPIADPSRIIVDIPEVNFQIPPGAGRGGEGADALVKAYRFGALAPGKSRVVIELARPACLGKVETRPVAKGAEPARLTIEMKPCSAEAFAAAAAAAAPPPAPAPSASASASPQGGPPVIVLDPGHGGVDGGAYGVKGTVEKLIVFEFAQELKRRLESTGHFRVLMTRNSDAFVSLEDRVKIAEEANAALFISIHADTLPGPSSDVSGATVYTCSDRASDAEAARIADRENAADKAAGVDTRRAADPGVADILFDLKRRETRAYAHIFSHGLVSEWQGAGRLNRNPQRSAGFMVLKAPDFPSVLVELGYLSNAQDVANMTSADWRGRATAAMAVSIERFFAPAPPTKPVESVAASRPSPNAPGLAQRQGP